MENKKEENIKKEEIVKIENNQEKDFKEFHWRAPEYNFIKKGIDWYFYLSLVSIILIVFAIFQKNFLFIVFILLVDFFLIYNNNRKPQILDFKILKEGIDIHGEYFLKYEDLEGFSFYEREGLLDELVLKKKTGLNRLVFLPVDNKSKEIVKEILKEKLEEFEYEPSTLDILFERFF